MGRRYGPETVEMCFRVSFEVPEERFGGEPPTPERAVEAAMEVLRRFTTVDIVPSELTVDPGDPRQVSAEIWIYDDPSRRGVMARYDDVLDAVMRSLGQRCATGEPDGEWRTDLHSDVGLLDALVEAEWAEKSDRSGKIHGYPLF